MLSRQNQEKWPGDQRPLRVTASLPAPCPGATGRFEASVIEERRKGAEDLLRFTVHIPALNNSPQLKEFFRVCTPACSPQHLGKRPATRLHPMTPPGWSFFPAGWRGDTTIRGVQGPAHPSTPSDPTTP